jgi:hypothetical protein
MEIGKREAEKQTHMNNSRFLNRNIKSKEGME